jgi:proteasome lid subunit RPN8/RPN11
MDLSSQQIAALFRHAATSEHEVCGVLIGRRAPRLTLETIVAARNVHATPNQHFLLDAPTLLRADAAARAAGLELIGFYHSHPNGVLLPSTTDRGAAWPGYLTLIVAVERGRPRSLSAWIITADGRLRPESIRPRFLRGARPAHV